MEVKSLTLDENHTWRARPGYKICVIDHGAVRFDFPQHWICDAKDGTIMLHDREPSIESCDLGVSVFRYSPEELEGFPVRKLLLDVCASPDRPTETQSEIREMDRGDTRIHWLEQTYTDKAWTRAAKFRAAIAHGPVLCLFTMSYWANRADPLDRAWDEMLRSLTLGARTADPCREPVAP